MAIAIRIDDLTGTPTRDLLALHLAGMRADSPADGVRALDLSALRHPDVTVWSAWDGTAILGIGALKALGDGTGEIKSMRTHPDRLRRGAAGALLRHMIGVARSRGWTRLSLETGSGAAFDAALALYHYHGFTVGAVFGGYAATAFSQFLHLPLGDGGGTAVTSG